MTHRKWQIGWWLFVFACLALNSCASVLTALEVIGPIAAEALTKQVQDKYGRDVDEGSAWCGPLPDEFMGGDETGEGWVYILCRAKPMPETE